MNEFEAPHLSGLESVVIPEEVLETPELKVNPGGIEVDPTGNISWRRTTKEEDKRVEHGYL